MAKKMYYYIGIHTDMGYVFITEVDRSSKNFFWNVNKTPMAFTNKAVAEDMLDCIRANGFEAILITDFQPVEKRYITPHFLSRPAIADEDEAEFVGQIVDIMEDFLEEKGIVLDNPEREDYEEDPDSLANIFGKDYDYIADRVRDRLLAWKLVESKSDN